MLVQADRVLVRSTSDTLVLLAVDSDDQPVTIGGSAAALWDAFREPSTVRAATERIVPADETDPEGARTSIRHVVDHLVTAGLLVPAVLTPDTRDDPQQHR